MSDIVSFKSLALALLFAAAGCGAAGGDPKEREVRAAVTRVQALLNRTQRDAMSALSFGAAMEQGGTPVTYIVANLPDNAAFTCYEYGAPTKPYCVVIKSGPGEREFTIEGYGKSLDKPIVVEKASVGLQRRGG